MEGGRGSGGDREREREEKRRREGVSDKASETRGGVGEGDSKRYSKEGVRGGKGGRQGEKDADVGGVQQ